MRPAAIVLTPIALLAAFYLIAGHFWYALGIVAAMVTCASLAVAIMRGAMLADLGEELDRRDREHAADVTDLTAALAEATATLADARVVIPLRPVAGPLRSVPTTGITPDRGFAGRPIPEQRSADWWPWLDEQNGDIQ